VKPENVKRVSNLFASLDHVLRSDASDFRDAVTGAFPKAGC
jgi:hypothetical protein